MIKMTIQDLKHRSSRCPVDCNRYIMSGCPSGCTSRFRIEFTCPNCGTIRCFFGGNCGDYCASCKHKLPDMYLMKSEYTYSARVKYHVGGK